MKMIKQIIDKLEIPGKLIYLSQYGSHLYGLNTENSDLDFRGVYIPNLDDMILGKAQDEINTELEVEVECYEEIDKVVNGFPLKGAVKAKKVKVDVKIFSLQKFIKLCSKADTNALDLLFSLDNDVMEQYIYYDKEIKDDGHTGTSYIPIWYILNHKNKLINTDRLESPITYAFKQATKYGLKGERRQVMLDLLKHVNTYLFLDTTPANVPLSKFMTDFIYEDGTPIINQYIDGKHVKIDVLDNKGKEEKYLYVCGVQHQFNLELKRFAQRLEEKINKEYTSQRTKQAADGNDWKALSHAIRILLEVKQLLEDGCITFPCIENRFLLRIKQGKISREVIDEFFNKELSNILEKVQSNKLNWKYDEEFWNKFIIKCVKE